MIYFLSDAHLGSPAITDHFGHTHLALDIPITDKSRAVFLGDCFEQWTYAQLDEQGNLELKHA